MKITSITAAKRRDDVLRIRDEYDAETKKFQDQVDEAERKLRYALKDQRSAMERTISDLIGPTSLELEIKADPWGNWGSEGWSIQVKANDRVKFEDKVALAWNWEVSIDRNGEIVKDSGSWSGLKAVTADQIADLEESVRILKILNSMDWQTFLNSPKADRNDFVDPDVAATAWDRNRNRPNFESDLETATIEDAIETGDTAFELEQDSFYRGHVGIIPTGVTDKFIKGYIFPISYVNIKTKEELIEGWGGEPRRTSRTNLVKKGGDLVSYKLL